MYRAHVSGGKSSVYRRIVMESQEGKKTKEIKPGPNKEVEPGFPVEPVEPSKESK